MRFVSRVACILLSSASVQAFAQAGPVEAQAQVEDVTARAPSSQIDEIVVTAQRREQSLSDVPMSISVLSASTLESRGFQGTADLATLIPGFSYTDTGLNTPVYTIRGVGFNDPSLATTPTVAVYLDEIPLTYPAFTKGATHDLARVEVLKGPQGILYGQNSTGGTVNYIPAQPSDTFGAGLTLGYSRFDMVEAKGYLTGPVAPNMNMRLALSTTQGGRWQKNFTRDERLGAVRQTSGRFMLDWHLSDSLFAQFALNGWVDKSDNPAPQYISLRPGSPAFLVPEVANAPLSPERPRAANWVPGIDFSRNDTFLQPSLRLKWDMGSGIDLSSISSYSHYKTRANVDRGGMAAEEQWIATRGKVESFYQELRIAGDVDNLVTWMIGGNYRHDDTHDYQLINIGDASTTQNIFGFSFDEAYSYADQDIDTWAIFANADWRLPANFELTTGLRYTKEVRDYFGCSGDPGDGRVSAAIGALSDYFRGLRGEAPVAGFGPGMCYTMNAENIPYDGGVPESLTEDNLSLRAALNWKPGRDSLFYISFSRGYKAGAIPTASATYDSQLAPIAQEEIKAYEAGMKVGLFDRRAQITAAVFHYDYVDKQLYGRVIDPAFGPIRALVNIPKSVVKGFEAELVVQPVTGLRLNGAATYLDTKIKEYVGYSQTGVLQDFAGASFNFTPKWSIDGGFTYEFDTGGGFLASFGANLSYRSRTTADFDARLANGDIDPAFSIKPYTLLDLSVGIHDDADRWSLRFWGKNVTNTYYYNNVFFVSDAVLRMAGKPATYGVTLGLTY